MHGTAPIRMGLSCKRRAQSHIVFVEVQHKVCKFTLPPYHRTSFRRYTQSNSIPHFVIGVNRIRPQVLLFLALPKRVVDRSLKLLRGKLIKIGAKAISHSGKSLKYVDIRKMVKNIRKMGLHCFAFLP